MSTPTPTAAWEQDDFWREVVSVMTGGKKLRSDAYLQKLTEDDLESLRLALLLPGSLQEQTQRAPKWRGGARDGEAPSTKILCKVGQAIRQALVLRGLERQQLIENATRKRCGQLGINSGLADAVVTIVGEEALKQHAVGVVDDFAIKAAGVLIKRNDQLMEREKFEEARRTNIERALEEFAQFIKGQPQLLEEFESFKARVMAEVK